MSAQTAEKKAKRLILRQSHINEFLRCRLAYYAKYVLDLKYQPNAKMTLGSIVDAIQNVAYQRKIEGTEMSTEEALDLASQEFTKRFHETNWGKDNPSIYKDDSIATTEVFMREVYPRVIPLSVQEEWYVQTSGPYDLTGTFDVVSATFVGPATKLSLVRENPPVYLRDLKITTRTGVSQYSINRSVQTALYTFAYRSLYKKQPSGFVLDTILRPTRKKTGDRSMKAEYRPVIGAVDSHDEEWLFEIFDGVYKDIVAGSFYPNPYSNTCDENCACQLLNGRRP